MVLAIRWLFCQLSFWFAILCHINMCLFKYTNYNTSAYVFGCECECVRKSEYAKESEEYTEPPRTVWYCVLSHICISQVQIAWFGLCHLHHNSFFFFASNATVGNRRQLNEFQPLIAMKWTHCAVTATSRTMIVEMKKSTNFKPNCLKSNQTESNRIQRALLLSQRFMHTVRPYALCTHMVLLMNHSHFPYI